MLRSLRDGAKQGWLKYILLGFMALAVGGLVLTDVGGFFRGGISNNLVAKGKGIEISIVEFDRGVRRILARQGVGPGEAYQMGLIDQVLRSEIQSRILAKEARKIGIVANDEVIAGEIAKLADGLAIEGMSKKEALQTTLRSQGVTEEEFINALRQELSVSLLTNALATNVQKMPFAQAKALYEYQNERRNFEAIVLSHSSVKNLDQPTSEQLQKFYEARKIEFAKPETRSVTIATLKSEMIADNITISDEEARKYYDDTIQTYQKPERRTLQQAIISDQKQAQEVLEAIKDKKIDFEKAVVDITGGTKAYLGENAFGKDSLIETIADPVFKAKKGDLIGPIQSPLGWHIVAVNKITAPETTAFNSVKKEIKKALLDESLIDELIETANALDDQLAGGEELEVVVKEIGLTTETISGINQAGLNKSGKDQLNTYQNDKVQILEAAFDYNVGESSPVLEMADGRYVVVRVDEITPLSYTPFDQVKATLEKDWMNEQRRLANMDRAGKITAALKEGKSLKEAAKEAGATIQSFNDLKRAESKNKAISLPALRQIFDAEKGAPVQFGNADAIIIGQVTAIELPETSKAEKEIVKIQEQNSEYLPQEYMGQYLATLLGRYKVQINQALLQQVYGTPQES